jgi:hypothetical protein
VHEKIYGNLLFPSWNCTLDFMEKSNESFGIGALLSTEEPDYVDSNLDVGILQFQDDFISRNSLYSCNISKTSSYKFL